MKETFRKNVENFSMLAKDEFENEKEEIKERWIKMGNEWKDNS